MQEKQPKEPCSTSIQNDSSDVLPNEVIADDDKVTMFLITDSITNETLVFNTDTLLWSVLPPPLRARIGCGTAVSDDGKFYLVGGWDRGYVGGVDILDLYTLKWSTLSSKMSVLRSDCAVVVEGNRLIVIGGYSRDFEDLASVEVCDLTTRTWSALPPMSCPRAWYSAAVHRNQLIVVGGYNYGQSYLSSGEIFSFEKGVWSPFPCPLLHARGWLGMAVEDDKLFVVGGRNREGVIKSAEMFDLKNRHWSLLPPVPLSSLSAGDCSAAALQGKLYACFSDECFVYDIESEEWTSLPAHPIRIPDPSCFLVKVKKILK
jgi:hypothetical protein